MVISYIVEDAYERNIWSVLNEKYSQPSGPDLT